MRKIGIIFCIVLFWNVNIGYTQTAADLEWAPLGATWYYEMLVADSLVKVEITDTAIVRGKKCSVIEDVFPIGDIYTYEENNKVYVYTSSMPYFQLLYDFNAGANESWRLNIDSCYYVILSSKDAGVANTNGYNLDLFKYQIDSYDAYTDTFIETEEVFVIEKIGALTMGPLYPLFNAYYTCTGFTIDWQGPENLNCYQDETLTYGTSSSFCKRNIDVEEDTISEWAPLGATWHYSKFINTTNYTYQEVLAVDTMTIQGQQCTFLYGNSPAAEVYTYKEDNKVYYYNDQYDSFEMAYDFNATVGDSWTMRFDDCYDIQLTVIKVGELRINDEIRKSFELGLTYIELETGNLEDDGSFEVIENIGGSSGGIFPMLENDIQYNCNEVIGWFGDLEGLNCYEDPFLGFYNTGNQAYCKYEYPPKEPEWCPFGATWYYQEEMPFFGVYDTIKIEVLQTEKEIQGKNCRAVVSEDPKYIMQDTLYTYEENDKVYIYDRVNDDFEMLYDFTAEVGDSWEVTYESGNSVTFRVDSIATWNIDGYDFKCIYIDDIPILQYIGPAQVYLPYGPFMQPRLKPRGPTDDSKYMLRFLCYESPTFNHAFTQNGCNIPEDEPITSINLRQGRGIYNQGAIKDRYAKGDTIINGISYVKWYDRNHVDGEVYFGAVREIKSTQRYWIYPADGEQEYLLYDFSAPLGERFSVYSAVYGTVVVELLREETITLVTGEERRKWLIAAYTPVSNIQIGYMYWIEGIGLDRLTYMAGDSHFYLCHYLENNQLIYESGENCIVDPVFPGDADDNGEANALDLLPIGLNYGKTGTPRSSTHYADLLAWEPQISEDWVADFASAYNKKHVDTNGDGLIDSTDRIAILRNYGKMHKWSGKTAITANFDLSFGVPDEAEPGDMVAVDIMLGSENNPVEGLYGIAFTVNYDTALVKPNTMMAAFINSWFGEESNNMLPLYYDHSESGEIDIAMVRIDQQEVQGHGKVAEVHFVMDDDLLGKTAGVYELSFSNIHAINLQEEWIEIKGQNNQIVIANEPILTHNQSLKLYPNPIGDRFNVQTEGQTIQLIEIYNGQGQLLIHQKANNTQQIELNTHQLNKGIYLIRCQTSEGVITKKIIK